MTPTRRNFLSAIAGSSIVFSGCTAPLDPGGSSERNAGTEAPAPSDGGAPPWQRSDSESDIVLTGHPFAEQTHEPDTVTVDTVEFQNTVELEPQERWASENVSHDETTTTVTVSTASGLESRTEWPGETDNELVLQHTIYESEIRVRGIYKHGHERGGERWVSKNLGESPTVALS